MRPVGNAWATGADVLLLGLLAVAALTFVRSPGFRSRVGRSLSSARGTAGGPRSAGSAGWMAAAFVLLVAFGGWTAASGLWGYHPVYAATKGSGYAALALGAGVVSWSGLEWDRAMDAWLVGALATVALSLVLAAVAGILQAGGMAGLDGWTGRVLYRGGSVVGLPAARLRGPFLHPTGLGDYLVVSGAIAWARWPALVSTPLRGHESWVPRVGACLLGVALVLTFSSAWLAAGVLFLFWGRSMLPGSRERRGRGTLARSYLLRATGGAVAAVTLAGLIFPLRIGWGRLEVVSSGIRPLIWADGLRAFLTAPVRGVGAAPFLAEAPDPLDPAAGPQLWDAHNAYLSILGQLGLVGLVLVGGAGFLVVQALRRPRRPDGGADLHVLRSEAGEGIPSPLLKDRARKGLLAALLAMGVHGVAVAGEDFRHWWAVLALAGLVTAAESPGGASGGPPGGPRDGNEGTEA